MVIREMDRRSCGQGCQLALSGIPAHHDLVLHGKDDIPSPVWHGYEHVSSCTCIPQGITQHCSAFYGH